MHLEQTPAERSPGRRFLEGCISALVAHKNNNEILVTKLKEELVRREGKSILSSTDVPHLDDWDMLSKKLLRFRPRFIGALGAYAALSKQSFADVEQRGGLNAFRMLWFMGSAQDDLIDSIPVDAGGTPPDARTLRRAIFGPDQVFYQAAFTFIGNELEQSSMRPEQKRYIKIKMSEWFRFLVHQEADIMKKEFTELTFETCVRYREEQNQKIGEALVACLNGDRCLDDSFQALEQTVPMLSFRTQIIDDIADIAEDVGNERPSYAVGALVGHPEELSAVRAYCAEHQNIKITPALFKKLAPHSSAQVEAQFKKYGEQLLQRDPAGAMLARAGDAMFTFFPIFRDIMHKINPRYANF